MREEASAHDRKNDKEKNNEEKDVLMQPYEWSESYFSKPYNVAEQHL